MNEFFFQSQDDDHSQRLCFQNDHLGDWNPEMDCCRRLTFRQPVRTDSEDGFRTGCRNASRQQQSFSSIKVYYSWVQTIFIAMLLFHTHLSFAELNLMGIFYRQDFRKMKRYVGYLIVKQTIL